jgi:ATP synthase protein I
MPLDNNHSRDHAAPPAVEKTRNFSQQFAIATELPFILIGSLVVGGVIGFILDRWLHTKPLFMIVLGFLGFFAGLREMLRRLPK